MAGWIKMALAMEVGLGLVHIVLDGDRAPHPKKGGRAPLPIFGPSLLWPNGWMQQGATWHGGRPQPRRLCKMGTQPPTPKGAEPHPIFGPSLLWLNGCMDQDATWYGGRPQPMRHCVRCGPSSPQKKRAHPLPPNFGPCLLWPIGWMDEDAAWYGSRPRPRPHCTRRGRSSRKRGTAAPLFLAHVYCGHVRPS